MYAHPLDWARLCPFRFISFTFLVKGVRHTEYGRVDYLIEQSNSVLTKRALIELQFNLNWLDRNLDKCHTTWTTSLRSSVRGIIGWRSRGWSKIDRYPDTHTLDFPYQVGGDWI